MSGIYRRKGVKAIDMYCIVFSKALSWRIQVRNLNSLYILTGTVQLSAWKTYFFTFGMRHYRLAGKKASMYSELESL
jgi:hypothetical protein